MSTERKPGSRGSMARSTQGQPGQSDRIGSEPGANKDGKSKGSTKTVSRRQSFKKKPRK